MHQSARSDPHTRSFCASPASDCTWIICWRASASVGIDTRQSKNTNHERIGLFSTPMDQSARSDSHARSFCASPESSTPVPAMEHCSHPHTSRTVTTKAKRRTNGIDLYSNGSVRAPTLTRLLLLRIARKLKSRACSGSLLSS